MERRKKRKHSRTHLLGQMFDAEHVTVSAASPLHCLPSYLGAGSVQVRVRVFVPEVEGVPYGVQEAEHEVQLVQSTQLPSTVKNRQNIVNINILLKNSGLHNEVVSLSS